MGEITQINTTRRGRISVYVDGEFLFAVEQEAWQESGLSVGMQVDEETLSRLLRSSNRKRAKAKALSLLSARSYPKARLEQKLAAATDRESAGEAVARMEELGLVDDRDYAIRLAEELCRLRDYAPRRIRFELSRRGIGREEIDAAIEALDWKDEEEHALSYVQKKYGVLRSDKEQNRAAGALARLGYGGEAVRYALRRASDKSCPESD